VTALEIKLQKGLVVLGEEIDALRQPLDDVVQDLDMERIAIEK
jgi:hypothetical protein